MLNPSHPSHTLFPLVHIYFKPFVNGINISSATIPTSPVTTPKTIFPNTIEKHIPTPRRRAPKIASTTVPTVFPLNLIGSFPDYQVQGMDEAYCY